VFPIGIRAFWDLQHLLHFSPVDNSLEAKDYPKGLPAGTSVCSSERPKGLPAAAHLLKMPYWRNGRHAPDNYTAYDDGWMGNGGNRKCSGKDTNYRARKATQEILRTLSDVVRESIQKKQKQDAINNFKEALPVELSGLISPALNAGTNTIPNTHFGNTQITASTRPGDIGSMCAGCGSQEHWFIHCPLNKKEESPEGPALQLSPEQHQERLIPKNMFNRLNESLPPIIGGNESAGSDPSYQMAFDSLQCISVHTRKTNCAIAKLQEELGNQKKDIKDARQEVRAVNTKLCN